MNKRPSYDIEIFKKVYNDAFFDEDPGLYKDSTVSDHHSFHSNVFALYAGLVDKKRRTVPVEFIKSKGMVCNVYVAYYYLKSLCMCGEYEKAYELITSKGKNSWSNMLREGATTAFESWSKYQEDRTGKYSKNNISLCHPWSASAIIIIVEDLIGLKVTKPGWEEYNICSHFPPDISFDIEINVKTGRIII